MEMAAGAGIEKSGLPKKLLGSGQGVFNDLADYCLILPLTKQKGAKQKLVRVIAQFYVRLSGRNVAVHRRA